MVSFSSLSLRRGWPSCFSTFFFLVTIQNWQTNDVLFRCFSKSHSLFDNQIWHVRYRSNRSFSKPGVWPLLLKITIFDIPELWDMIQLIPVLPSYAFLNQTDVLIGYEVKFFFCQYSKNKTLTMFSHVIIIWL